MTTYNCATCNYSSTDCSNYKRHLKSKRHKIKLESVIPKNFKKKTSRKKEYIPLTSAAKNSEKHRKTGRVQYMCEDCGVTFTRSHSLSKHVSSCIKRLNYDKTKELERILKEKDKILKEQTKQMLKLERDKEYYKKLIDNYGSMGSKNFNSVTYILNSYPNAPHLETIEPKKLKQFKNIGIDNIRDIISDYCNNKLVDNIIEAILFIHKKEDPSEQSIWATDSSRHNYIIKELLKDKDSYWVVDKKGIKSENYLIKPILSFIREKIIEYLDIASELLTDLKLTAFKRDVIMDSQKYGSQLIKDIDDSIISKDIIKNLAKHIHHYNKPQIEEIEDCITLSP